MRSEIKNFLWTLAHQREKSDGALRSLVDVVYEEYTKESKDIVHSAIIKGIDSFRPQDYCKTCGCMELLCGHNGPKGCSTKPIKEDLCQHKDMKTTH